ncbi:MAG: atpC [Hyphomicrobiales bacterium]|nr:atpC [Hyphomicrobiales bacterium]
MAVIDFELISPERVVLTGEMKSIVLPGSEGEMTIMSGHEPLVTVLQVGMIVLTDVQDRKRRAFVWGGFAEITGRTVTVLAERTLSPDDISRDTLDREIASMDLIIETAGSETSRHEAEAARHRLLLVRETLTI